MRTGVKRDGEICGFPRGSDLSKLSLLADEQSLMAAAETAGPSTTLRSGRDDNSVAVVRHFSFASIPATTELSSRPERSVVEGPAVYPLPTHNSHLSHLSPLVIPTGAYPDFLLRAASDDHVCGSP
jgi:hypothetical protein